MPPYLLLSFLIGAICGTLFHLWRGKNLRDLFIYLLTGVAGCGLGQALGNMIGLDMILIGPVHIVEATIASWIMLFLIHWVKT
jgi:uncharacterized membrane protein YeaQ/YmgE (transglycosylase-associated protein family)